jgi:hypothetical protein
MANAFLTPTAVTREALRVLHQKLNFVGTITREYDDSFARQGAKIGDTLKVRLPNQYVVRSGSALLDDRRRRAKKVPPRPRKAGAISG